MTIYVSMCVPKRVEDRTPRDVDNNYCLGFQNLGGQFVEGRREEAGKDRLFCFQSKTIFSIILPVF